VNFVIDKNSKKFLAKLDKDIVEVIRQKLSKLDFELDNFGFIKSNELDIKILKRNLFPKKRLRVGNIRVIFDYEFVTNTITNFDINFRGNSYLSFNLVIVPIHFKKFLRN